MHQQAPTKGRDRTSPHGSGGGRIPVVDALRGFALLGILMVNITYFASAYHGTGLEDPGFAAPLDRGVRYLVTILFETKFYLLFSFLFGYSFTLQMDSAARTGSRFVPRFLRRLSALFLIGAFHAVLLFPGDILTTYACLGLLLLAARRVRPRTAVRTAIALLVATAAGYLALATVQMAAGGGGVDAAAVSPQVQRTAEGLRGGPGSVIATYLDQLPEVVQLLVFFQAPAALAAFLLGLAAGKRRVLTDLGRIGRVLRRLQWIGAPVGLIGGIVYAHASLEYPGTAYQMFALGLDMLTAPLLAAAYAATLLRWTSSRRGRRAAEVLSPAGRMTLTAYLTQSLACALVFTGYGAAMVGRLSPPWVLAVAIVLFAAQLAACKWWMGRHPHGPLEWVLRAVTNAAWPRRRTARWTSASAAATGGESPSR
ncbi:DUF418 domain-containing protein [Couchioplanes caeruleus]|uniref:DUF418 domain-containing protein n=2 Tax=Couchioplanes caeruleus TaxID=56438 RepID=A0A1K0GTS1_9ACTN|nr:DUF418 domain-containing protein [Couchioplanes caeruleus]OJF12675.1 hypothetical protein BG844_19435 [Couchioplanes caeruleus subsp. caeruleus]ROP27462.1 uncharacterized protein EDD30_0134 [Couchioplanes caeruleus]